MKKSDILKQQRSAKVEELRGIVSKAETEKRELTAEEITKRDALLADCDALDGQITAEERVEKRMAENLGDIINNANEQREQREVKRYSLMRAIQLRAEGRQLDGIELEMHQEADKEYRAAGQNLSANGVGVPLIIIGGTKRAMTATGTTTVTGDQGGLTIPTQIQPILSGLKDKMVLGSLGVTYLTGLSGNLEFPKASNASAAWATENGDASETSPTVGQITMSPKRLAAFMTLSKQLLYQSSDSIEAWAQNEIAQSIAIAVESAAINGTGSNNQPSGLLAASGIASVAGGTNGLAPAWSHIVALESAIANNKADIGTLAYLTNPKVRGKLKTTTKATSGDSVMVWDTNDSPLNGYKAGVSTLVPSNLTKGTSSSVCSAIIFGNWAELFIGQWAGLDIVVDPYTVAGKNQIKLVVNSLWDVMVRRPEAFAAMLDALTA